MSVDKPKTTKWPNRRTQGTRHPRIMQNKARGNTNKPYSVRTQYKPSQWQTESCLLQNLVVVKCTCHTLYISRGTSYKQWPLSCGTRHRQSVGERLDSMVWFACDFLIFGFSPEIQTLTDYRIAPRNPLLGGGGE